MVAPGMKEFQGGPASSRSAEETSTVRCAADDEKTLKNEDLGKMVEDADKLMKEGSSFVLRTHFEEATDCYSRALDIRGELAPECFEKSDDILDSMLKKEEEEEDEGWLYTDCRTTEANNFESTEKNRSSNNYYNKALECCHSLLLLLFGELKSLTSTVNISNVVNSDISRLIHKRMKHILSFYAYSDWLTSKLNEETVSVASRREVLDTLSHKVLKARQLPEIINIGKVGGSVKKRKFGELETEESNFELCISLSSPTKVSMSSIPSKGYKMGEFEVSSALSNDLEKKLKKVDKKNHDNPPVEDALDWGFDIGELESYMWIF